MTDKTTASQGAGEETSEAQPKVDMSQYVTVDDLHKLQSVKDREVAAAQARSRELEQAVTQLQSQLEAVITDPTQRAQYVQQRTEAELERYKRRDQLERQRQMFVQEYGVPAEVLLGIADPSQLTKTALDWQKAERERIAQAEADRAKEEELKKTDSEGGHVVSKAAGTPPTSTSANLSNIDKQIEELRKVSRRGGSAGAKARVEILKLQASKASGATSSGSHV